MATTTAAQTLLAQRALNSRSDLPEEFWQLVESYRDGLILQAQTIVGSREDAEDVVQETFFAASRDFAKCQRLRLGAWLRSINRANAVDRLRGKRSESRRIQACIARASEDSFTTGGFSRLELRESLQKAVSTLPLDLQNVVRLRFFEHCSYQAIAEHLKIPIGTVSSMLMDASAALYARLRK